MNSEPKIKTLIIIIGIGLALSIINNKKNLVFSIRNIHRSLEYNDCGGLDKKKLKISTFSERIHIDNNWSAAKAAGICTGKGTYSDPYVIQDLVIEGTGSRFCILIENSNVHFKVKNCTTFSSEDYSFNNGIRLNYVTNSTLINNNCSSNEIGIILYCCDYNTIFGNDINDNRGLGIILMNSDHNNMLGNVMRNNYYGISLMSGSGRLGEVGLSEENTIFGNTVINNEEGIVLHNSNNNKVSENAINNNNEDGIRLYMSYRNSISKNTISNNNRNGISLSFCLYNNLIENTIIDNYQGLNLSQSDFNNITGNILSGNDICWEEYDCEGNIFENNDCGDEPAIGGYNFFFVIYLLIIVSFVIKEKKKIS